MSHIICIKARSHTDFELYLMAEKYKIPYEFLLEYKGDRLIYKVWLQIGTGGIYAEEERPDDKTRNFVTKLDMSEMEKNAMISILPIRTGEVIRKYKGDIEEKEQKFKDMINSEEHHKKQMLNRKYDSSNIVCINSNSSKEQIFSVCVSQDIDYGSVIYFLESNPKMKITKVWFEKKTSLLVAYNYVDAPYEHFEINPYCLIPRDAINRASRKAVQTPKLKVSQKSLDAYQKANKEGYFINIPKFERVLESGFVEDSYEQEQAPIDLDLFDVNELKELLQVALDDEDYESAAELRDAINEIEEKNKNK